MTLEEVAERLGKAPSTIKNNFKRTQETLAKQGVALIRNGTNNYDIEIIDKTKTYFTISQLIDALEEWKNEVGDVPVYRFDGRGTNLESVYRVILVDNNKVYGGISDFIQAIVID